MPRRPTGRRHQSHLSPDINLIPVMNLFIVLIPFLLLTAIFVKTAAIDTYLPAIEEAGKKTEPRDILTIHVTSNGFMFSGTGKEISPIGMKDGGFDFELLTNKLVELKKETPQSEEVILLFEQNIPYETVIKLMDSTREAVVVEGGKPLGQRLFPLVSLGEHINEI